MHYEDNDEVRKHVLQSYDDMPTRLEMANALFTRKGTSEGVGAVRARSIRLPLIEHYTIEALASYSGLSANKTIVELIQVALDEVFQSFSSEEREAIFTIRSGLMRGELCDADGQLKRDLPAAAQGEI